MKLDNRYLRHICVLETRTEALRRAMGLQSFINQEVAEGAKVLLELKSGKMRQLVI